MMSCTLARRLVPAAGNVSVVAGLAWGYKQGCNFATQKCISDAQVSVGTPPHFNTATSRQFACMLDGCVDLLCAITAAYRGLRM